jgi:phosphoglycolate phosphatase-like HAD superfamily hydrolase
LCQPTTMRIGFDLDGTLADMQSALAQESRRLFPNIDPANLPSSAVLPAASEPPPVDPKREDPDFSTNLLTTSQQRALWKAVCARENFWETLDEVEPGALSRLNRLSKERRWEVIFLTSRPESAGDTAQIQSHRWLSAHGFEAPSIFVVHGSRGKISAALALDVFVDDRPENCLDISIDSKARPILVWRGGEENVPGSARQLGIGAVASIAECLDILEDVDRAEKGEGGIVERFRRLLGLKPKSGGTRGAPRPALATETVSRDGSAQSSS